MHVRPCVHFFAARSTDVQFDAQALLRTPPYAHPRRKNKGKQKRKKRKEYKWIFFKKKKKKRKGYKWNFFKKKKKKKKHKAGKRIRKGVLKKEKKSERRKRKEKKSERRQRKEKKSERNDEINLSKFGNFGCVVSPPKERWKKKRRKEYKQGEMTLI